MKVAVADVQLANLWSDGTQPLFYGPSSHVGVMELPKQDCQLS